MRELMDLIIGAAFWGLAFAAFTSPCWAPVVAFVVGASLGYSF